MSRETLQELRGLAAREGIEDVLSIDSSGRDFRTIFGARTGWTSVRSAGILPEYLCSR